MKIELKHLAPYLPYGLKIQGQTNFEIAELSCVTDTSVNIRGRGFSYGMWADIFDIKPILRPLSFYYKGLTGGKVMDMLGCALSEVHEIWDLFTGEIKLSDIKKSTYDVICRNHIDMFGLIKEGLAIDINTL